MPDAAEKLAELHQLLLTSHQQQLDITRALLAAQKAHAESVEATLRQTRLLMWAMALLLVIVAGINLYALWPRDVSVRRVIITEEAIPEQEPKSVGKQV